MVTMTVSLPIPVITTRKSKFLCAYCFKREFTYVQPTCYWTESKRTNLFMNDNIIIFGTTRRNHTKTCFDCYSHYLLKCNITIRQRNG